MLNICTFKTEGSKSAIQTAGRGLGIDSDVTQYLASMIPVVRGNTTSLQVMIYGDEENNIKPAKEFLDECSRYPKLLETATQLEGLICGRSIHASGVIIFATDYTEHNAMMKSPNKQVVTQWDMDDSAYMGGLKVDYLTITNLDAMHLCMNMLLEHGYIEWKGSLRETYNAYFHPDVLDYTSEEMWKLAEELKIVNLFQFQTPVGSKAIQAIKPRNLEELGTANAAMRLMVEKEKGASEDPEQPLDTFVRYKNDIGEWYKCMRDDYQLEDDEIEVLEKYLKQVYGLASMQEEVMMLSMDEKIASFTMTDANFLRKSIAKKKKKLQQQAHDKFYEKGLNNGTSKNMLDYVWNEVIKRQLGYSFSLPHLVGYSTIAVQEMNMAYHYPIIYWNTANLIVDAGADESREDDQSTEYGKIATAIAGMQKAGIDVAYPLINEADFGFKPDEENNRIICGFKSLCGVGDDAARAIVANQPYASFDDFCERVLDEGLIKNSAVITLIKAGAFTELDNPDRKVTMRHYLEKYKFSPIQNLTFSQFPKIEEFNLLPVALQQLVRIKNFKDYVLHEAFLTKVIIDNDKKVPKKGYHDREFTLDDTSQPFFEENFSEDSILGLNGSHFYISEKLFLKEWKKKIEPLREWLAKEETLKEYNDRLFEDLVNQLASGTIPKWEMDSLSFYYTEHELAHVDDTKYGIEDFFKLPEEPEPYDYYTRYIEGKPKHIPKNRITRIAGTVLDANKNRHTVALLTTTGVVNCKFSKGQFVFYNKRISVPNPDKPEKNIVIENSWFKRGTKLLICGYRSGDVFRAYRYQDTIYLHTAARINEVRQDGTLEIQQERYDDRCN